MTRAKREQVPSRLSLLLLALLFALSGATALVYEVVWFRLVFLRLGGTGLSVATVTATFMGGLGLGAWIFGRRLGQNYKLSIQARGWIDISAEDVLLPLNHDDYLQVEITRYF